MPARACRLLATALLALILGAGAARAHAADASALKAAYVYNFGAFTTWPDATWRDRAETWLCVDPGLDPSEIDALARLEGKPLHERPLRIRVVSSPMVTADCLMYVRDARARTPWPVPADVLTVCYCAASVDADGSIFHVALRGKHLAFEIDRTTALRAGFAVSSRLLRLASAIR